MITNTYQYNKINLLVFIIVFKSKMITIRDPDKL